MEKYIGLELVHLEAHVCSDSQRKMCQYGPGQRRNVSIQEHSVEKCSQHSGSKWVSALVQ